MDESAILAVTTIISRVSLRWAGYCGEFQVPQFQRLYDLDANLIGASADFAWA